MSISRRIVNLARAELNALLEKAAERPARGDAAADAAVFPKETARERVEREADEFVKTRARKQAPPSSQAAPRRPATAPANDPIRKAYAALEIPAGSDFDAVKKAYRAMMRKYHPDRHAGSAEKQKVAHDLTTKLTDAYRLLEKHLKG